MNPFSPLSVLYTALTTLCIGATLGGTAGWMLRGDHEAATRLKTVQAGVQKTAEGKVRTDTLATEQSTAAVIQAKKDRIITKEVIRYVDVTPAPDRCTLPGTWRVRHDTAATGEPADPPRLAAGGAAPVADAAALETVADNYAACRLAIEQVKGWQRFWKIAAATCGATP